MTLIDTFKNLSIADMSANSLMIDKVIKHSLNLFKSQVDDKIQSSEINIALTAALKNLLIIDMSADSLIINKMIEHSLAFFKMQQIDNAAVLM